MNEAAKLRLASIFTTIVAILTSIQGAFLTSPPFTEQFIFTASAVITYVVMALTAWKQYLSPEISDAGIKTTLAVAIIATIAGIGDLLGVFNVSSSTSQWIKWGISVVVMVLNIFSKGLFPSSYQTRRMESLKNN